MSLLSSPTEALVLALRVGSIGVAVSSLEMLARRPALADGGLLSGNVTITRAPGLLAQPLRSVLRRLATTSGVTALVVIRLLAALAIVAGAGSFEVLRVGAIVVALTTALFRFRSPFGIHASGTMVLVVFIAAALGLAVGTRRSLSFALAFIAAQGCLCYFVAGAMKLRTSSWRDGTAIPGIVSTVMWGNRQAALALRAFPAAGFALCWMTMLLECSIPLSLVLPLPAALGLLAAALAMHLILAVEMGLNSFVWALGSTYPAILFSWYWLHH